MDEQVKESPDDLSFEENVQEVLRGLPQPIQDFLTGPERDVVTARITQRYNLHADQAGRFQKAFLFMLMGIFSPEQFAKDLADVGVSPETVRALANDVNEEVFKPLRAKEEAGSQIPAIPIEPAEAVPLPVRSPQAPAPHSPYSGEATPRQNIPVAPVIPPPTYTPLAIITPPTAPVIPAYVAPAPVVPVQPQPQPPAQSPTPQHPSNEYGGATMRTMATDMLAVREHKEPEPVPYTSLNVPLPPQHVTRVSPAPATVAQPRGPFGVSPATPLPGQAPQPLIKEYAVDPYRETM